MQKNKKNNLFAVSFLLTLIFVCVDTSLQSSYLKSFIHYNIMLALIAIVYYILVFKDKQFTISKAFYKFAPFLIYVFCNAILLPDNAEIGFFILFWSLFIYKNLRFADLYDTLYSVFMIMCGVLVVGIYMQKYAPEVYMEVVNIIFLPTYAERVIEFMSAGMYNGCIFNTTYTAGFLSIGIILQYDRLFREKSKLNKIICVLSLIVLFLALNATSKRANLVYCLIGMAVVFLFDKRVKYRIQIIIGVVACGLVGGLILAFSYESLQNSSSGLARLIVQIVKLFSGDSNISSGRFDLWVQAWELFKQNPIFGIGWYQFDNFSVEGIQVHNEFLRLLCETGIVGFLLFVIPMIFVFIKSTKQMIINKTPFSSLAWLFQAFFVLYCFTDNAMLDRMYMFMYLVSLCMIYGDYSEYSIGAINNKQTSIFTQLYNKIKSRWHKNAN